MNTLLYSHMKYTDKNKYIKTTDISMHFMHRWSISRTLTLLLGSQREEDAGKYISIESH